jgi:uncharacterized membrane protein
MIGSILLIISPLTYGVVGIIGIILLFMGIKGLSNYYQDPEMYQNTVKGIINYVIALIAFAVAMVGIGLIFVFIGIPILIVGLIVAFIFYVQAAKHLRKTFNALAQRTGEHSFETAGYLLWLGALLTIVLVGAVLIFVAWIFAAIGFFSMKTSPQPAQQPYGYAPPPPPPPPTSSAQGNAFCPNCGAPIQPGTVFCPNCGKPLQSS